MVQVVSEGRIKIQCRECGSVLSAKRDELKINNTYPPTWHIACPVCGFNQPCHMASNMGGMICSYLGGCGRGY